ncbi:NifB/NifX family molybdenum-iron cluster-binding protein [Halothermothrix orenii]|uniref:Dinitrogenase iron-molybdenum cofactor biosynthesis protein n=1 Tax=Halothermothrix orenii (strain H 168 / OCM 544 / DSM 9562) TaxID=373903 RepID=B8D206_HALOH|nr:NifB/NifX family molybdenum-iron cluster-binding protein [Halothermothrix orenii]ACL69233.1 Dinitrogenase iron-molybdenum cofactor biosynthesis protein [Halothermothrix orenii H 168]
MSLTIACATDDGVNFINRHFGDADYYYIYNLTPEGATFIKKVENTTGEEEGHADPEKARSIVKILKENENVQVGVSRKFGPNIKRVKKHFVPVLVQASEIEEGLKELQSNYDYIMDLWQKGEGREHLVLK